MSGDVCGDNRFELIEKYKKRLIEGTNIESRPEEMVVLDSILFRFWQMGWLEDVELKKVELDTAYECGKNANKWIPVSERLPDQDKFVLACDDEGDIDKAFYVKKEDKWFDSNGDKWKFVTAWMPLPEPYKESEGKE